MIGCSFFPAKRSLLTSSLDRLVQDEIYNTATTMDDWEYIVSWYGRSLPRKGEFNARSVPRRVDTSLVSLEAKRRICHISAIDYCCLNMELPPECAGEEVGVYCSLDRDREGDFRIQPWFHPHEIQFK